MTLNPNLMNVLKPIAVATGNDGYIFANTKNPMIVTLAKQDMIEGNAAILDPADANKIAFRATTAGMREAGIEMPKVATSAEELAKEAEDAKIAAKHASTATPAQDATAAVTSGRRRGPRGPNVVPVISYTAGARSSLPTGVTPGKRGGNRGESYPFGKLEAPDATGHDSFFVKATAEMPDPAKTLRAAVFSANKRYKEKNLPNTFAVYPAPNDEKEGVAGARVYRIK